MAGDLGRRLGVCVTHFLARSRKGIPNLGRMRSGVCADCAHGGSIAGDGQEAVVAYRKSRDACLHCDYGVRFTL